MMVDWASSQPQSVALPLPQRQPVWYEANQQELKTCIVAFFLGSLACLVSLLILWLCYGRKLKDYIIERFQTPAGPSIFSPHLITSSEVLSFLEDDDALTSLEVVGRGACGKVYKKELPLSHKLSDQSSIVIAIKRIIKQTTNNAQPTSEEDTWMLDRWVRQVRSEIQTVGRIRHPYLLPLLAHVPRPNCHYLIYEYMKNGSLEAVLNNVADGYLQLDWSVRYKIAFGISAGLCYLHHHHRPQIIHRDLKPANILLDDNMEPRIADFGLAKLMPEAHTHMTSNNVAGTFGYIAPEYYRTFKYTAKCDIYSFGVILAVLVIGKLPSDDFFHFTEEYSLVMWLRNLMNSENAFEAIDAKLEANGYEEQMLLMLKIACFCTADDPKERPDSKDVKVMLAQIKH